MVFIVSVRLRMWPPGVLGDVVCLSSLLAQAPGDVVDYRESIGEGVHAIFQGRQLQQSVMVSATYADRDKRHQKPLDSGNLITTKVAGPSTWLHPD